MHEAQLHSQNSFLTLTFDDKHLPDDFSVEIRTWQLFMKRLRLAVPDRIRFFACGEYGDENLRPHYHALIFNHRPYDMKFWKLSKAGHKTYTSESVREVWGQGQVFVGNVSYQSAAYCARYVLKKIGGPMAPDHYRRLHPVSGKLCTVKPEFAVQSRRPGLGARWASEFKGDFDLSDEIIVDGKRHPVPRYYHRVLTEQEVKRVKIAHALRKAKNKTDYTKERLRVRETVKEAQLSKLKREL